jgi:hypothetical protein
MTIHRKRRENVAPVTSRSLEIKKLNGSFRKLIPPYDHRSCSFYNLFSILLFVVTMYILIFCSFVNESMMRLEFIPKSVLLNKANGSVSL